MQPVSDDVLFNGFHFGNRESLTERPNFTRPFGQHFSYELGAIVGPTLMRRGLHALSTGRT